LQGGWGERDIRANFGALLDWKKAVSMKLRCLYQTHQKGDGYSRNVVIPPEGKQGDLLIQMVLISYLGFIWNPNRRREKSGASQHLDGSASHNERV